MLPPTEYEVILLPGVTGRQGHVARSTGFPRLSPGVGLPCIRPEAGVDIRIHGGLMQASAVAAGRLFPSDSLRRVTEGKTGFG